HHRLLTWVQRLPEQYQSLEITQLALRLSMRPDREPLFVVRRMDHDPSAAALSLADQLPQQIPHLPRHASDEDAGFRLDEPARQLATSRRGHLFQHKHDHHSTSFGSKPSSSSVASMPVTSINGAIGVSGIATSSPVAWLTPPLTVPSTGSHNP